MALDEVAPETGVDVITSWLAVACVLVRLKFAEPLTPVVVALTVYGPPTVALAVNVDAVARPLELVVTTHSLAEGLPPEQVANVPEAPEVGAVKVTLTPGTPVPPELVTLATRGDVKALCTFAL